MKKQTCLSLYFFLLSCGTYQDNESSIYSRTLEIDTAALVDVEENVESDSHTDYSTSMTIEEESSNPPQNYSKQSKDIWSILGIETLGVATLTVLFWEFSDKKKEKQVFMVVPDVQN